MATPSILVLAGEASGDYHAAALVANLRGRRPQIVVSGIGGDRLRAAGMDLLHHYKEINTIALSEGFGKVRNIIEAYLTMKRELRSGRHQLFIPVDFPDVNIRLCKIAKDAGVPVCYYISPQIWAWRRGRIHKIARRVDRMMTIFPFEERLYRDAGVSADFVGHTMVREYPSAPDRVTVRRELGIDPGRPTVALVPGSRPAEIRRMLPVMCEAARIFNRFHPGTQFILPLAGAHLRGLVTRIVAEGSVDVGIFESGSFKVMAAADCGLVTSGTATLEALLAGMPHAVVYKVDAFTWWFGLKVLKPLVMSKDIHLAIANVIAIEEEGRNGPIEVMSDAGFTIPCQECGRPLFVPEILQDRATADYLAEWLVRFRTEDPLTAAMARGFERIRTLLSPPSSGKTAESIVLEILEN
ncbi:MAG: lipid-A-disaccharide synthase [Desulfomonile sp.]|nr:lipid-A-disaccharide synthase [Desulfomonile sp.]